MFYEIEFNAKLAEGYTKEETLTAVTHLTSSTVEEAEGLYDKLFAK